MSLKNIYFSFLIYWSKLKGVLTFISESIILLASLTTFFILVYQFGFDQTPASVHLLRMARIYILMAFFIGITMRYVVRFKDIVQEKMLYLDISIYFLLFAVLSSKVFFRRIMAQSLPYLSFLSEPLFVYILLLLLSTIHLSRQTFTLMQSRIKPSLLFLLSFVFVIIVGSGLLMLPNTTHEGIHFIDALFTSTTCVCVTGLTTVNVATVFTPAGHLVILMLIQIGGIGVMTFTSFIALSFMSKSSFTSKMMLKDMLNEDRIGGLFRVILNILFVTLLIEAIGAYFIYTDIKGSLPGGTKADVFFSIFHAVSAFCNAGISTLSGNVSDPLVADKYNFHFWIALLIIFGGIGFPILFNYLRLIHYSFINGVKVLLRQQPYYIHSPHIINVQTYIVVVSTLVLLVGGTAFYLFFEMDNTLLGLPWKGKLADAFLGAVTPRTAGFNVASMSSLAHPTLVLTFILMVIGASPMSTGGGVKVTTVFVALLTTLNIIRQKERVDIRGREIASSTIQRAFAIISLYFLWAGMTTWILSYTEKSATLFTLIFEVISALSTVGLSLDFTPHLSEAGKIVIICTMLVGRIGVLTFFMSFSKVYRRKNYTYPQENILM